MLDYRYETFLTLAVERHYTRTAKKLNLTQPAVTQQIRHLQEELGVALFYFQGKQLLLTEEGKYLQGQLILLSQDIQQIQRHLYQTKHTISLTFGATLSIGEYVMPPIISAYLEHYPDNHVNMIVGNTKSLIEGVELGNLDFALIEGDFNQSKFGFYKFSEEKIVAVCSPDSPLWKTEPSLQDLFTTRLFVREQGSGSRMIIENGLRSKSVSLSSFSQSTIIGNIGVIKQLIKKNQGISFLYYPSVKEEIAQGTLKEIPIKDFALSHPFHVIYLKKNRELDKIQQFMQFQNSL